MSTWEPLPAKRLSLITKRSRRCKAGWLFLPVFVLSIVPFVGGTFYINNGTNIYSTTGDNQFSKAFTTVFATFIGGGSLSFTKAKGIDIAWDLVIGRGGQLLLLWIAGYVYAAVLDQILESTSANVTYDLYISVAISGSALTFTGALIRRLFTTCSFWPKSCFMLYSALYLGAYPTLIAAMTSYIAKNDSDTDKYSYTIAPWIWVIVCSLQFIWSLGMYGLWVDACRKSQLFQAGRRLGLYRGILDLSEAIRNELGPDTCAYSDAELKKAIIERSSAPGLVYRQIHQQQTNSSTADKSYRHNRKQVR